MKTTRDLIPFFLAPLLLSGCFGGKAAQQEASAQKRTFVPQAEAASPAAPSPGFAAVKVRAFRALPPFDVRNFIVRRADGEFATDYYNGWLAAPQELVRVQASRYLEQAKLFAAVYDAGCGTVAPLGLEGVVSELYLDHSGAAPAAVVSLRLLVLEEGSPTFNVLFTAEKQARVPLASAAPGAAAQAFNKALTQCLEALAQELAQAPLPRAAAR